MGKNHRHSKKLKSEKNKVHIKSKTKFLPKGQNVTNTAFKIKPIVLQEQLKQRESTNILYKKPANIDELVTKLKHFNETVKAEACQDLKDATTKLPIESIQKYLSSIIQNTSALIQDRERKVRRASVKLLHAIFEKISVNTLRPFFTYILTNLKCAMTNINKHVQEDSLLLLDAILEHANVLIAETFNDFFPNFLLLISKLKNQSERSLSLNLEGKVTSVKWGVKVLTRVYGILNSVLENRNLGKSLKSENSLISIQAGGTFFIPIYKDYGFFAKSNNSGVFLKNEDTNTNLDGQILNLTQLLHEIWMEALPEKKKNSTEPTILSNEESVAVFLCVVNILRLIQEYVQNSRNEQIFLESKSTQFLDSLMSNFPYSHNRKNLEMAKEFPKCFSVTLDQNCVEQNLTIIYIFITLRVKNSKICPRHKTIASYLNNCLNSQHRLNSNSASYLIKILKEILLENPYLCTKLGINDSELVQSVSTFYNSGKTLGKCKNDILEILTSSKLTKHQPWIEKLPDFLLEKSIPEKLINGILDLCRKNQKVVQDGVKKNLKQVLRNLSSLEISDAENLEMARKNLVSIFFYLPDLSNEDFEEIQKFIAFNNNSTYSEYFRTILNLKNMFK